MRRLHAQTNCGHREGLLRVFRVPWDGRDEDKGDEGVWR